MMKWYKCDTCGKIIKIVLDGVPDTICCGEPMKLLEIQTADWEIEKHVPKITVEGNKITVDIGISMGTPHPMTEEHYIRYIGLKVGKVRKSKLLKPGDEPKVIFLVENPEDVVNALEICNLHGLWKGTP